MSELKQQDKLKFSGEKGPETFDVRNIAVKSFKNKIWKSGFIYGVMTGGAIVLLIIQAIRITFG